MFTGLVQTLGKIESCDGGAIAIRCPDLKSQLAIGDSVAVNGVCLTVVEISAYGFVADLSPETLNRSNLGESSVPVNLELALAVGDRLGGHFVTGHIDGVGTLCGSKMAGGAWELKFSAPAAVARYIVAKGSVAINGISLTVAECNNAGTLFSTAVIPHTYEYTNLHRLAIAMSVNLEADMLGKYVEKFLRFPASPEVHPLSSGITSEFLTEHGW